MDLTWIHRLDRAVAPCLIRVAYWIAVVVIVIGTLFGIAGGVRTMTGQVPPVAALQDTSRSSAASGSNTPDQNAVSGARSTNSAPEFGYRRYRGYGFDRRPRWIRALPPPARGGVIIGFSLLRGVIAFLIVRILAEIGLAILAIGAKARETSP